MTTTNIDFRCLVSLPRASESAGKETPFAPAKLSDQDPRDYSPRSNHTNPDLRNGYSLIDRVCALSEPWRTRFLDLIVQRGSGKSPCGCLPSRTQLAIWLADQQLAYMIRMMLRAWTHED